MITIKTLEALLPEFDYQPDGSFRGWLRTITLNKFREHLRRKSIKAARGQDTAIGAVPAPESTWDLNYRQQDLCKTHRVYQSSSARQLQYNRGH